MEIARTAVSADATAIPLAPGTADDYEPVYDTDTGAADRAWICRRSTTTEAAEQPPKTPADLRGSRGVAGCGGGGEWRKLLGKILGVPHARVGGSMFVFALFLSCVDLRGVVRILNNMSVVLERISCSWKYYIV